MKSGRRLRSLWRRFSGFLFMAQGLLTDPRRWRPAHVRRVGASPSACRLQGYLHASRLLVLGPLLYGCGSPGTPLADWRDQLTLKVDVADRASSVATNLYVSFRAPDSGRCPVLDATMLVNDVKLPEVSPGGENSPAWVQIQSDPTSSLPSAL